MKKILSWIWIPFAALLGFLIGLFAQQPKVNKLKKQLELLQHDNQKLITMVDSTKQDFQELLIQHKALKALQFRKKADLKDQLAENLIMQYAIKAYLTLLIKSGRYGRKMEKGEIVFFKAFEKVIDGRQLSASDKVKIKDYIMDQYGADIKNLHECEYTQVLAELYSKSNNDNS